MTELEEKRIWDLRSKGKGYKAISIELNLPIGTIKSYCTRNNVGSSKCRCCGESIIQAPGRKQKKFCSERCKTKWWNRNRKIIKHRFIKPKICEHCGSSFLPIKRPTQRFCCRECYLIHIRKGEENVRDN